MKSNSTIKKTTWNAIFLCVAGLIAGIIIASFILPHPQPAKAFENTNDVSHLIKQTDSLEKNFRQLQRLNENYSTVLSDKNLDSNQIYLLDSLNILITRSESDFLKQLDSLQINDNYRAEKSSDLLAKIINAYRLGIGQADATNTIRNSFNIGNTDYNFDQQSLNTMQIELRNKEAQVITLTSQLYTLKNNTVNNVPVDFRTILQQQDSVLNTVLQAQKNRNQDVLGYADKIKRENDRLKNELLSLENKSPQSQQPATVTVLPASTKEINEQVNLAKADCYLTRADANQIISNAKQRKDLLQSALQILSALSQSSNSLIKQQAQQKLEELKTIAANNHD